MLRRRTRYWHAAGANLSKPKRRSLSLASGFLVAALLLSSCGDATDTGDPGLGIVVRVLDGDTADISISGKEERVRFIGIDTPEPVGGIRDPECYGTEASDYTKRMLPVGTRVRLERDIETHDKYDRVLAYIYRQEDDLFINLNLVEDGYADDFPFEPNTTHASLFAKAAANAKQLGLGLWGACGGPDRLLND